jgi:hypothetical protein
MAYWRNNTARQPRLSSLRSGSLKKSGMLSKLQMKRGRRAKPSLHSILRVCPFENALECVVVPDRFLARTITSNHFMFLYYTSLLGCCSKTPPVVDDEDAAGTDSMTAQQHQCQEQVDPHDPRAGMMDEDTFMGSEGAHLKCSGTDASFSIKRACSQKPEPMSPLRRAMADKAAEMEKEL